MVGSFGKARQLEWPGEETEKGRASEQEEDKEEWRRVWRMEGTGAE